MTRDGVDAALRRAGVTQGVDIDAVIEGTQSGDMVHPLPLKCIASKFNARLQEDNALTCNDGIWHASALVGCNPSEHVFYATAFTVISQRNA